MRGVSRGARDDVTVNGSWQLGWQPGVLDFDHIHQRYTAIQRKLLIPPVFYTTRQFNPNEQQRRSFVEIQLLIYTPDANDWTAKMDAEIENMHCLNVFSQVPCPSDKNIITRRSAFRRKFENGTLIKQKARSVAHGFTQVSGIDYHEARLYASVVRLEMFRVLISIAALFNHYLRQFDVSTAYLHGEIDGEIYMGAPPGYGTGGHRMAPLEGPLRVEAG